AVRVRPGIAELQRIAAGQVLVDLLPQRVAQQRQPLARGDAEVERALGAHRLVRHHLLAVDDLLALFALDVEALGDAALLLLRGERLVLAAGPGPAGGGAGEEGGGPLGGAVRLLGVVLEPPGLAGLAVELPGRRR